MATAGGIIAANPLRPYPFDQLAPPPLFVPSSSASASASAAAATPWRSAVRSSRDAPSSHELWRELERERQLERQRQRQAGAAAAADVDHGNGSPA